MERMQRWELGGMGGCREDAEVGARRYGRMWRGCRDGS